MKVNRYVLSVFSIVLTLVSVGASRAIAQSLSPVDDKPTGWYGSISPDAVFGYDVNVDSEAFAVEVPPVLGIQLPPVQIDPIDIKVNTETGFGINSAVGYQFEDARVELNLGYNRNTVDGVSINDAAEVPVDGRFEVWSVAANGYYDISTGSAWRPYIGGGVGVAKLAADDVEVDIPVVGQATLDDSGLGFIFQAQAGVAYDFSQTASAFVGYRLQGVPGTQFTVEDVDFDADTVFIHSIQAGGRFRF